MSRLPKTYTPREYRPLTKMDEEGHEFQIRHDVEVFNLGKLPVAVVYRDGLVNWVTPPSTWTDEDGVMIRIRTPRSTRGLVKFDPDALIVGDNEPICNENKRRKALAGTEQNIIARGEFTRAVGYEIRITRGEIQQAGGSLYVEEADVVIGLNDTPHAPLVHPFHEKGIPAARDGQGYWMGKRCSAMIGIDIIDNENQIGDRYAWFAGKVFRIRAKNDRTLQDGVYVSNTPDYGEGYYEHHMAQKHYPIDSDQLPINLFRTREEAEHNGNPKSILEAQLASRVEDTKKDKLELEREIVQLKREREESKARYEERKEERDERRDDKSSAFKLSGEILNWTLKIATALIGIIALVSGRKA